MILTFYNNFSIGSWMFLYLRSVKMNVHLISKLASQRLLHYLRPADLSKKFLIWLSQYLLFSISPQHCLYRDSLTLSWKQHFRKKSRLTFCNFFVILNNFIFFNKFYISIIITLVRKKRLRWLNLLSETNFGFKLLKKNLLSFLQNLLQ